MSSLDEYINYIAFEGDEELNPTTEKHKKTIKEHAKNIIGWIVEKWKGFIRKIKDFFTRIKNHIFIKKDVELAVPIGVKEAIHSIDSDLNNDSNEVDDIKNEMKDCRIANEAFFLNDLQYHNQIVILNSINKTLDEFDSMEDIYNQKTTLMKTSALIKIIKHLMTPITTRDKLITDVKKHENMINTPLAKRISNSFSLFMQQCLLLCKIIKLTFSKKVPQKR